MTCFLFGHAPSNNEAVLEEAVRSDRFCCRRCRRWVVWAVMPKTVQARVSLARNVLQRLDRKTTAPISDDTQAGTEKPSGFAVDHDLEALREKVERDVLNAVFTGSEHGQCEKEWEPDYGKEIARDAAQAILSTLLSRG